MEGRQIHKQTMVIQHGECSHSDGHKASGGKEEEHLARSRVGVANARSERALGINRSSPGQGKMGDCWGGGIQGTGEES